MITVSEIQTGNLTIKGNWWVAGHEKKNRAPVNEQGIGSRGRRKNLDKLAGLHDGEPELEEPLGAPVLEPVEPNAFCKHMNHRGLGYDVLDLPLAKIDDRKALHSVLGQKQEHGQKRIRALQGEKWRPAE